MGLFYSDYKLKNSKGKMNEKLKIARKKEKELF